jgi:hypothetical protein
MPPVATAWGYLSSADAKNVCMGFALSHGFAKFGDR